MLKSNRGITLVSLVIYIVCLMVVIEIMSVVLSHFLKTSIQLSTETNSDEQYAKFLSYITKDVNADNLISAETVSNDGEEYLGLKFSSNIEHRYVYYEEKIYFENIVSETVTKKILLCTEVSNAALEYDDETQTLSVRFLLKKYLYKNDMKLNFLEN